MCRNCGGPDRRQVLALLAALPLVAGCRPQTEGPEDIRWGRETCAMCGMIISDPHFAAEIRGGQDRELLKFDDIGDAVLYLQEQPWKDAPATEFWVRDYETGTQWLEARKVRYKGGVVSPMDYGFAALAQPSPDSISFDEMVKAVIAKGLASGCHVPTEQDT